MALRAERFEAEMIIEERVARLESDVHHIRSDVAETKVDIRRIDTKVDALKDSVAALEIKMLTGFADINSRMLAGFAEIKVGRAWDRVWFLMIAAALLGIVARVFKWI